MIEKTITLEQVRGFDPKPCYDPSEIGCPEGYSDTILNFAIEYRSKVKEKQDLLWILLRNEYFDDRILRLFAVWCARKALSLVENPDERSVNACNVAERFANGEATNDELAAARDAARDAAWDAARYAARDAALDAARYAAWDTAWDAAGYAAWDAQIDKLIEIIKTGDVSFEDIKTDN